MSKASPTPIEAFLAPLSDLARHYPEIEGLVFWVTAEGWSATPSEALESEEIAFYAEGLLIDGFRMHWSLLALPESPDLPDHIRLQFWQEGAPPPGTASGWVLLQSGRWPAD